ncbi:hypothetical protein POTOM_058314 [Populus tomentosa]|uniref:C-JID domain-containing protein n=1 Tax=Populus tomentosa TaxID=118781 RepID=A0A8X7XXJ3_POPTO|nr:hypothetical protein POTOM_058314 [Populus tomentosa]
MSRLRLLRICNACFDSGPKYLSNELCFLAWRNYPSKSLPSSFQPENLVEVHLCYSNLRQLRLGLSSLTKLDLRNCNLGEGAVPNDIGYLSSLRHLDLSYASITPSTPTESRKFQRQRLSESDWWNNMFPTLLRKCFQGPSNLIRSFSVVIPGSEIPTWFSHQSEGSSVSVQTSPHSLENDECLGYAVCASLEYDGCASSETFADFPYSVFGVPIFCFFNGHNYRNMMSVFHSGIEMQWKRDNIPSDHLWYLFFPSRFKIFDRHVSLRFETYWPQIKVIKCGVRPVYHQDECFQESGGSTMRGGGALVKRLGHTNDVGETSGSLSSDEQPPTKKLKQI